MGSRVGILGLGIYLPPEVRTNDWWDPEVVARWTAARAGRPAPPPPADATEGVRRVAQATAALADDPFQGTVARHIAPADMSVFEMEERAAREAIARAGIREREIDLLLTNTISPDYLLGNPACILHQRLGLATTCFTMHTDVASHAFTMQLALAEAMIAAGSARCALIVQSCIPSRLIDAADPMAPYFGDAAAAAVIGRVGEQRGIEASIHLTDSRHPRTLVAAVPGGHWYDDGRPVLHVPDPQQTTEMFLGTADRFKASVDAVLDKARCRASDVDFLCIHQGAAWIRTVAQDYTGLAAARSIEVFARTAYVFALSQPITLALAERDGQLGDGDLVVVTGGGPGSTYGATLVRWGT